MGRSFRWVGNHRKDRQGKDVSTPREAQHELAR
jgi:hypothetical protein